jgi:hypothetical protein
MKPAEAYIINQPEPYRSILLNLQLIIETQIPEIELLYKWRIPFYFYKGKPFCYFNASHKRKYVDLGIVKGFQLTIYNDKLISENRSSMKSLRYYTEDEIDNTAVIEILGELRKLY